MRTLLPTCMISFFPSFSVVIEPNSHGIQCELLHLWKVWCVGWLCLLENGSIGGVVMISHAFGAHGGVVMPLVPNCSVETVVCF